MYTVLGATGHIGFELVRKLLAQGKAVTGVTHDPEKRMLLEELGADVAVADIHDVAALRNVFSRSTRVYLLNPPAAPSSDTDAEEHRTLHSIVEAIRGLPLEKIVLQSTYGAQKGERLGDLSVLYYFEQALFGLDIPVSVLRAAFYMSNWDQMLQPANDGHLPSMLPRDFQLPMVAPADIAAAAAQLLEALPERNVIHFVEGPQQYSPTDVANAFATALDRDVQVDEIPQERWVETYRGLGFSARAADAYYRMTECTVNSRISSPPGRFTGETTLQQYIIGLVQRQKEQ